MRRGKECLCEGEKKPASASAIKDSKDTRKTQTVRDKKKRKRKNDPSNAKVKRTLAKYGEVRPTKIKRQQHPRQGKYGKCEEPGCEIKGKKKKKPTTTKSAAHVAFICGPHNLEKERNAPWSFLNVPTYPLSAGGRKEAQKAAKNVDDPWRAGEKPRVPEARAVQRP